MYSLVAVALTNLIHQLVDDHAEGVHSHHQSESTKNERVAENRRCNVFVLAVKGRIGGSGRFSRFPCLKIRCRGRGDGFGWDAEKGVQCASWHCVQGPMSKDQKSRALKGARKVQVRSKVVDVEVGGEDRRGLGAAGARSISSEAYRGSGCQYSRLRFCSAQHHSPMSHVESPHRESRSRLAK
mgnify:CR=1 FL=1